MPPTSNSDQRILVIGAAIAVCVIVGSSYAAYRIGYGHGFANGVSPQTQSVTTIPTARAVMGSVESVSGQKITLKNFQRVPNTSGAVAQDARMTVSVDQTTLLERFIRKDAATLKSDQAAFDEKIKAQGTQSTTTPLTPPMPFTAEKITLGDIKAGDFVVAYSAEDISKATTFTATKIDIQDASAIPLDMRQ